MNYGVPNFGADPDVADSLKFASESESTLGHKWELKEDPDTKEIIVPEPYRDWEGHTAWNFIQISIYLILNLN